MKAKNLLLASMLAVGAVQAQAADLPTKKSPAISEMPFFFVNDTSISITHIFSGKEPGVFTATSPNGVSIPKEVVTITHFDVWKYGTNFANIDFLKSSNKDPSTGSAIGTGDGALEVYGFYRGTLSGNALTGSKAFSFGFVKDISLAFGFDANTKNTTFAPQKRDIVIGPSISFDVPGSLNVGVLLYKEWNHCGLGVGICTPNVSFNAVPKIESNYNFPLTFTGLPLSFGGFTNYVFSKGRDGFGFKTKPEFLTSNRFTMDLGKLFGGKANWVDAYVGYTYWVNKFGNDDGLRFGGVKVNAGSVERTVFMGLTWHAL